MQSKDNGFKIWVEISKKALISNVNVFRKCIGKNVKLGVVVKANAYGHGLKETILLLKDKVDVFAVDSIDEALTIRQIDSHIRIGVLGDITLRNLSVAIKNDISFVVYNMETIKRILSLKLNKPAKIYLKIETGLNRQGIEIKELLTFIKFIKNHRDYLLMWGNRLAMGEPGLQPGRQELQ